jgi:hypothetical protein
LKIPWSVRVKVDYDEFKRNSGPEEGKATRKVKKLEVELSDIRREGRKLE